MEHRDKKYNKNWHFDCNWECTAQSSSEWERIRDQIIAVNTRKVELSTWVTKCEIERCKQKTYRHREEIFRSRREVFEENGLFRVREWSKDRAIIRQGWPVIEAIKKLKEEIWPDYFTVDGPRNGWGEASESRFQRLSKFDRETVYLFCKKSHQGGARN